MKYILLSVWWVLSRLFALLMAGGVIAGVLADVPGAKDTVIGDETITFFSTALTWVLRVLHDDPALIVICLIIAAILRWVVIYPHAEKLREEVERERKAARSRLGASSAKKDKRSRK
ncbi:hypothetical protein [Defluviimonas sp. SAOS-178_SWC]|uniref:hypothetical protein n=1 Tax=Defluviimonas sp. SAOS-178_SWC TaxID=3121287 RepID=UPI0032221F39